MNPLSVKEIRFDCTSNNWQTFYFCRGVDGVLTDYLEKFVPWIHYPWYLLTIAGLAGLIYFNYNDVGVCEAIKMVWRL